MADCLLKRRGGEEPAPIPEITFEVRGGAFEVISFYDVPITSSADPILSVMTDETGKAEATLQVPDGSITVNIKGAISQYIRTGIEITEDTTVVMCMPEQALYWYGNECVWSTGGWSASGYIAPDGFWAFEGTKQTNKLYLHGYGTSDWFVFGTANALLYEANKRICAKHSDATGIDLNITPDKYFTSAGTRISLLGTRTSQTSPAAYTQNEYISVSTLSKEGYIEAIWIE